MDATTPSSPAETVNVTATRPAKSAHLWKGQSFGFSDILDTLNPLQHLPVISMIYRAVTGDTEGNAAKVAGDAVYGGIIGAISGIVDVAVKEVTGEDIGTHVLATLGLISPPKNDTIAEPAAVAPSHSSTLPPAAAPPATTQAPLPSTAALPQPPQDASQTLPKLGSETTSSMLAATASVTPLDVAKAMPAQVKSAPQTEMPATATRFMPIDTSDHGIMALKAGGLRSGSRPVALNLPPGALPATGAATKPVDFVSKMREGLDKYQAMMAARNRTNQGEAVDQLQ